MQLQQHVKRFLKQSGIRPKKRLGQNFLIDARVLEQIIAASEVNSEDVIVEIGAGLGHLTTQLADIAHHVIAIELDNMLFNELHHISVVRNNIECIHADILKLDLASLLQSVSTSRERTKVVANLPYYITTPILLKLLPLRGMIQTCVLMMQEEVAQRIVAPSGNKTYGSLSVVVNYHAEPEIVRKVPATCFFPRPKVDSALLLLKMRDAPPVHVKSEDFFFRIVRGAFMHRRKTLRNALMRGVSMMPPDLLDTAFRQLQLNPQRRGETLNIAEFADLANCLYELTSKLKGEKENV